MKIGFYPKLAIDGLRKNRRMTLPYILTCVGMVMMFYIVTFLHYSDSITTMRGGSTMRMFMGLGSIVIGVFACLFLFYTNLSLTIFTTLSTIPSRNCYSSMPRFGRISTLKRFRIFVVLFVLPTIVCWRRKVII